MKRLLVIVAVIAALGAGVAAQNPATDWPAVGDDRRLEILAGQSNHAGQRDAAEASVELSAGRAARSSSAT